MNSLPLPPQNAVIGWSEFLGGKRLPGEMVRCSGEQGAKRSSPWRYRKPGAWLRSNRSAHGRSAACEVSDWKFDAEDAMRKLGPCASFRDGQRTLPAGECGGGKRFFCGAASHVWLASCIRRIRSALVIGCLEQRRTEMETLQILTLPVWCWCCCFDTHCMHRYPSICKAQWASSLVASSKKAITPSAAQFFALPADRARSGGRPSLRTHRRAWRRASWSLGVGGSVLAVCGVEQVRGPLLWLALWSGTCSARDRCSWGDAICACHVAIVC